FAVSLYRSDWEKRVTPTYSWSLYTSSGEKIGAKDGILKLMLRPYITYGNLPNQSTPYFNINSRGMRGPEFEKDPPASGRIILVGGSSAFGTGLQSDQETLAHHLSQKLGVEVINAAVIGHQSGHQYAYVATEL